MSGRVYNVMNWINADEQLPEDRNQYLVYFPVPFFPYEFRMWVCRASVYGRDGEPRRGTWYVPDGRGGYYKGDFDDSGHPMARTFWMPLPSKPTLGVPK
jgi:hypothetical protein